MSTCCAGVSIDGGGHVRYAADHQAAVVAPGEVDPLGVIRPLVAEYGVLLIGLIVVDAEHAARRIHPAGSGRRIQAGNIERAYGPGSCKPGIREYRWC